MLSTLMHTYLVCSLASKRPVSSRTTPDSSWRRVLWNNCPMGPGRGEGTSSFPSHSQARALSTERAGGPGLQTQRLGPRGQGPEQPGGTAEERFGRKGVLRVTPVSRLRSDSHSPRPRGPLAAPEHPSLLPHYKQPKFPAGPRERPAASCPTSVHAEAAEAPGHGGPACGRPRGSPFARGEAETQGHGGAPSGMAGRAGAGRAGYEPPPLTGEAAASSTVRRRFRASITPLPLPPGPRR